MAARRARREEDGGEVEVERVNLRGGEIFPTAPCAFSHHYREKAKAKAKAIGIPRTGGVEGERRHPLSKISLPSHLTRESLEGFWWGRFLGNHFLRISSGVWGKSGEQKSALGGLLVGFWWENLGGGGKQKMGVGLNFGSRVLQGWIDYSGFQGLCLVALGDSPYPLSAFLPSPPPLSPACFGSPKWRPA